MKKINWKDIGFVNIVESLMFFLLICVPLGFLVSNLTGIKGLGLLAAIVISFLFSKQGGRFFSSQTYKLKRDPNKSDLKEKNELRSEFIVNIKIDHIETGLVFLLVLVPIGHISSGMTGYDGIGLLVASSLSYWFAKQDWRINNWLKAH